jgi:RimJ/RimL family protein N-acetyltransferase
MIVTERLKIVPATLASTAAALEGREALAAELGVEVPSSWPPEYLDPAAFRFTIDRLREGPEQQGWWLHFVVLAVSGTLIGSAGYKGPPSPGGEVEVGYGIVHDRRRRGYASEVVRGLVGRAFSFRPVERVIGETLPELTASIGVLVKCGFRFAGEGSEPGVVRYALSREEYASGS